MRRFTAIYLFFNKNSRYPQFKIIYNFLKKELLWQEKFISAV